MKQFITKLAIGIGIMLTTMSAAFGAQSASGVISVWSLSQTSGLSLISVSGADGSGGSVLCTVDATTAFGSTLMASAATAAAQGLSVSLTCNDLNQATQLQLTTGGD